jgi:hypothetical protein
VKLTDSQIVKKFPLMLWNPKGHYRIHDCPPPVPVLCPINRVHTPTSHILKVRLNIILPCTPGSPKWSLFLRFPHQHPVYASLLSHTRYVPRPSHSSPFYYPNYIGGYKHIFRICNTYCFPTTKWLHERAALLRYT